MRDLNTDALLFVETWENAATLDEVAAKLNIGKRRATSRAEHYRARGVPLKKFPAGQRQRVKWDRLAEFVKQGHRPEDAAKQGDKPNAGDNAEVS